MSFGLAWAERNDAAILEDDYDSEFRFGDRPVEPIRTLDAAGRVMGFVIPPRSLRAAAERARTRA